MTWLPWIGATIALVIAYVVVTWLWVTRAGRTSVPQSTTVTIGRNIGAEPMSADRWSDYRQQVDDLLTADGATLVVDTDYRGEWDGVGEDAHVDVALWDDLAPVDLDHALARIGRSHGQEAVGVSTGQAKLV